MENKITEAMVEYVKEQLKGHPMMEILSNIMTVNNEERQEDDPESWALTIHRDACPIKDFGQRGIGHPNSGSHMEQGKVI